MLNEKPTYQQGIKAVLASLDITQEKMCRETGIDYSTLKKLNKPEAKPSRLVHYTIMNYIKEKL